MKIPLVGENVNKQIMSIPEELGALTALSCRRPDFQVGDPGVLTGLQRMVGQSLGVQYQDMGYS